MDLFIFIMAILKCIFGPALESYFLGLLKCFSTTKKEHFITNEGD